MCSKGIPLLLVLGLIGSMPAMDTVAEDASADQTDTEAVVTAPGASPVVTLHFEDGHIGNADPTPFMRVHRDGIIRVHYPHYMKMAGDYELRLSSNEVSELIDGLYEKGLMTTDFEDVKRRCSDLDQLGRPSSITVHQAVTVLKLSLDNNDAPTPRAMGETNQLRTITWTSLKQDARRFSQVDEIQNLNAAVDLLLSLCNRPDLVRVSKGDNQNRE